MSDNVIWRDENRLVSAECGGFVDTVPESDLERYAADESADEIDRAFAAATLAVRRLERATHAVRLNRAARFNRAAR